MEACATRWGLDIRRAFGNRIELAILLGSLLGNRPANGRTRRWRNVTSHRRKNGGYEQGWTLQNRSQSWLRSPYGAPCRARLDLVIFKIRGDGNFFLKILFDSGSSALHSLTICL